MARIIISDTAIVRLATWESSHVFVGCGFHRNKTSKTGFKTEKERTFRSKLRQKICTNPRRKCSTIRIIAPEKLFHESLQKLNGWLALNYKCLIKVNDFKSMPIIADRRLSSNYKKLNIQDIQGLCIAHITNYTYGK